MRFFNQRHDISNLVFLLVAKGGEIYQRTKFTRLDNKDGNMTKDRVKYHKQYLAMCATFVDRAPHLSDVQSV